MVTSKYQRTIIILKNSTKSDAEFLLAQSYAALHEQFKAIYPHILSTSFAKFFHKRKRDKSRTSLLLLIYRSFQDNH